MNRFAIVCVALVGCGDDASPPANPSKLWLAPDQNETHVKLVDTEPQPY